MSKKKKEPVVCLVSSSGGHFEQLRQLNPILDTYPGFYVVEKTEYKNNAKYHMISTGSNERMVLPKMIAMGFQALRIWVKERPEFVITTGSLIAVPFLVFCKIFRKKFIYIETFARVKNASRTGKFMYKYADLFIYQWETLESVYPKGVFGGSIY